MPYSWYCGSAELFWFSWYTAACHKHAAGRASLLHVPPSRYPERTEQGEYECPLTYLSYSPPQLHKTIAKLAATSTSRSSGFSGSSCITSPSVRSFRASLYTRLNIIYPFIFIFNLAICDEEWRFRVNPITGNRRIGWFTTHDAMCEHFFTLSNEKLWCIPLSDHEIHLDIKWERNNAFMAWFSYFGRFGVEVGSLEIPAPLCYWFDSSA